MNSTGFIRAIKRRQKGGLHSGNEESTPKYEETQPSQSEIKDITSTYETSQISKNSALCSEETQPSQSEIKDSTSTYDTKILSSEVDEGLLSSLEIDTRAIRKELNYLGMLCDLEKELWYLLEASLRVWNVP